MSRVDGPVLELHKVRRSEAGSYLCIASNGHPPTVSRRVQLDIKCRRNERIMLRKDGEFVYVCLVRPIVHVPVQKVNAISGRRVQIECNIESYPRYNQSINISRRV